MGILFWTSRSALPGKLKSSVLDDMPLNVPLSHCWFKHGETLFRYLLILVKPMAFPGHVETLKSSGSHVALSITSGTGLHVYTSSRASMGLI